MGGGKWPPWPDRAAPARHRTSRRIVAPHCCGRHRRALSCRPTEYPVPLVIRVPPRSSRPAMKTALHSVSYAGVWAGQARLGLDDFLVRAKALGFEAVMLMAKRPHLSPLDYAADARARLRERLAGLGLRLACLAGYNDF